MLMTGKRLRVKSNISSADYGLSAAIDCSSKDVITFYLNGLALVLCLSLFPPVCIAEIYKWTDENGRVHFGDKPDGEDVERIEVKTSVPQDQELEKRREKRQRLLDSYDKDRQEKTANREQAAKAEKQRKENCAKAQKDLSSIKSASFLYDDTDDPNNPRVYSYAEREKATRNAEALVDKWCK